MRLREIETGTTGSRAVGFARVAVGTAALLKVAILAPVLLALDDPVWLRLPVASWLPPLPAEAFPAVVALWVVAGAAFALGWRTRPAGGALCLALLYTLLADRHLYSNHLYLLLTVTTLLTLADSGAALSLDARRTGGRARIPAWPVLLLKIQLSVVYGFAALAKLNLPYLSGGVLNAYLGRKALLPFPDAARTVAVMAALAWTSIALELFLAAGFWSRRRRRAAVLAGIAFHATAVLLLPAAAELVVFAIVMFGLYVLHFEDVVEGE